MTEETSRQFPAGFVWGTATASYQIEGAWNLDGKGVSIWDAFTQAGGNVSDGNNGDVACDSYHKYEEDIAMMKQLGVNSYRMSISWPRVIPDPLTGDVNPKGVAYYNKVIDSLLANGITPCVTLYHWDLPLVLEEKVGGWPKEEIIPYFLKYAEVCFQAFGDRVKTWITFNEPSIFLSFGYVLGYHAPGRKDMAEEGPYACVHNVVRAHAQVYRLYEKKFKSSQKGSSDFFGLNYYTTRYAVAGTSEDDPTYKGDCNFEEQTDPQWTRGRSVWLYSVPWGLKKLLGYIKTRYGAPVVYITENGFSDAPGTMQDTDRQNYIRDHLTAVHQAITEDGVDIRGYYCWTLLDNFEWAEGFNERFGLFHVDISTPERKRTAKESVKFFRQLTSTNSV